MKNRQSFLRGPTLAAFASFLILGVSGCASLPPPQSVPLSDEMIQSHRGDVAGLFNDWIKPQIKLSGDSPLAGTFPITDIGTQSSTEGAISKDFARFCRASGGSADVLPSKYGHRNICTDSNYDVIGEIETERFTSGGLSVKVDSLALKQERQKQAATAESARRKQDYAKLAPGSVESLPVPELRRLIYEFQGDDPQHLLPKAGELVMADAMRSAAERDRRMQAEREARAKAQENRQVGDRVCFVSSNTTLSLPTNIVVAGQQQYRRVNGSATVTGFVEDINRQSQKIKIHIHDISFSGAGVSQSLDSFSNFQEKGTTLHTNSMIWDDTHNWDACL